MDASISHDELGDLYAARMRKKGNLAVSNYAHIHSQELPDVVIWAGGASIHVIETKVSRSDFKRDAGKEFRYTDETYERHCKQRFEDDVASWKKRQQQEEGRRRQHHDWMNQRRCEEGLPEQPYLDKPNWEKKDFSSYVPRRYLGMGKYRSYLCPEGLIQPNEIPKKWGLIWYSTRRGGQFTVKVRPEAFPNEEVNQHGGAEYLLIIMKRMVANLDNWREAAGFKGRGRFVLNSETVS